MIRKKLPFIIAEAGNNHEGNFKNARNLIIKAAETGVDAIKFQTFKTENYVNYKNKKRFNQLKKFELGYNQFTSLSKLAKKKKLKFISTPFDLKSAKFLGKLVDIFKISSGDLLYHDLIDEVIKFKKPIIISTGCSNLVEIKKTLNFLKKRKFPLKKVSFLHCVSMYPAKKELVNLKTINYLKKVLKIKIGYSDHTIGYDVPILSYLNGAEIIEKHFTLNNNFSSFRDHKLSLNPQDMRHMVYSIKNLDKIIGINRKKVSQDEKINKENLRRSFYYIKNLKKGSKVNFSDIKYVRPFSSLGFNYLSTYKKKLKKNVYKHSLVKLSQFYK